MIEINNKKLCESCFCEAAGEPCPNCGFSAAEYTADPIVLPMGTRLNDKIVIGKIMGKGGFGITYLGYDLRIEKTIAVKEYFPNGIAYRSSSGTEVFIADARSAEAFENGAQKFYTEAEMVAQFNGNPNIVSVYDYFRANNTVYLVMEFIEGLTLNNYIKKHGRLTDGQALFVMDKIAAALSITHSAGVLHRDISPDNIMICKDGKVKLIDFGAARQIMAEGSSNLTVVMKPGYTPIEQYTKKGKQGAWTDIYSLGVSVYYALTEVIIDDPYARMDDDHELAENKHGINSDLWVILKKCTMINSSDRYGSAIDLRKALKSVSAPIKLEPIQLTDDDLKSSENNAPSDESAEEKKCAATAAPENEAQEVIEVFEDTAAPPAEEAVKNQEDDNPYSHRRKKAKGKKPFIIAAAAALLAVIATIVGVNIPREKPPISNESQGNQEYSKLLNTSSGSEFQGNQEYSTPVDTSSGSESQVDQDNSKPFYIPLDNEYQGDWNPGKAILKDDLKDFKGDIKITLDIEHINNDHPAMRVIDHNNKPINIQAYNMGRNIDGYYNIFMGQTKFAFVITREEFEKAVWEIKMCCHNLFVKGATVENYDPKEDEISPDAKIIQLDSEYRGWELSSPIPKADLKAFNGDVRVTLMIEYVQAEKEKRSDEYCTKIHFYRNKDRDYVNIKSDYIAPASWSDDTDRQYFLGGVAVPDKFTFIITAEEIEKLDSDTGLVFSGQNYIAKSAALEKA